MSFLNTLYPGIWLQTPDVATSYANILNYPIINSELQNRKIFSLDLFKGLCSWSVEEQIWKSVMIPKKDLTNNYIISGIDNINSAIPYLLSYNSSKADKDSYTSCVMIIPVFSAVEQILSEALPLLFDFIQKWHASFLSDNLEPKQFQLVFISSLSLPPDFISYFDLIEETYPDYAERLFISNNFASKYGVDKIKSSKPTPEEAIVHLAKSIAGMTSSGINLEFVKSFQDTGAVSPDIIYQKNREAAKRNGMLEFKQPKITFNDIGGLETIKRIISNNLKLWEDPQKAEEMGVSPIRKVLMVGVPGTGKSAICEATAHAMGLDLARTGISQQMTSLVGESEANMRRTFRQISAMAPLCVWIDEFGRDLSGGQSSSYVDGGTTDRVHGEFLTGLQELPPDVFLMCAANNISELAPETLRAGRFDQIFFVGFPTFFERISIVKIHSHSSDQINFEEIASATEGFTGAEILSLLQKTRLSTFSNYERPMQTQDVLEAIPLQKNLIWNRSRPYIQAMYKTAYESWTFGSDDQYEDAPKIINGTFGNSTIKVFVPKNSIPSVIAPSGLNI